MSEMDEQSKPAGGGVSMGAGGGVLSLTAAAVAALEKIWEDRGAEAGLGLRVSVERGGWAGMAYVMRFGGREAGDVVLAAGRTFVFVDEESVSFLRGCELDYSDALNDSGFKVLNPNAERACGCGTSFEPRGEEREFEYDPAMDGTACR